MQVVKSIREPTLVIALKLSRLDYEDATTFYGSRDDFLQVATFCWPNGKIVADHQHIKRKRCVDKTQEIMFVIEGLCEVRVFDIDNVLIETLILEEKEAIISYWGGIGFTSLKKGTKILEVKNGPYDVKNDIEDRIFI